jgi:hypothetical protein
LTSRQHAHDQRKRAEGHKRYQQRDQLLAAAKDAHIALMNFGLLLGHPLMVQIDKAIRNAELLP